MLPALAALAALYLLPLGLNALVLLLTGRPLLLAEDASRHGLLPDPATDSTARVRIFFHRGRRWRSLFGGHSFIVYKAKAAPDYIRYDWEGKGEAFRCTGWTEYEPGYGDLPGFVYAADGWLAETIIPKLEAAIAAYASHHLHDYRRFPGPNSNSFVQGVIDATGVMDAVLTPLAIGKDFPHDGKPVRRTYSGLHLTLAGLASLRIGYIEGLELSLLGLVAGVDWRRPALKIPSIGRIGLPACKPPPPVPNGGRVMRPEQREIMQERKARRAARRNK